MSAEPTPAEAARAPLPDDAHRRDIAEQHDRTLFVEAGAGTGKTSALVRRVVRLIEQGTTVDQLAVITFTEAAAAELRDRVRTELDANPSPEARAALDELDGAAISTLHGFAQRILAENPLEAGLPPVVDVHGEIGAQVDFDRRWRAHLDQLLDDRSTAELVQRAVVLGIQLAHLRALASILEDEWDRIPALPPWTAPSLSPVSLTSVLQPLAGAQALAGECTVDDDSMLPALQEWQRWAERAEAAESDLERLQVLGEVPSAKVGNKGRAPNWPDGCLAEVRSLIRQAGEAIDAARARHVDEVLGHLVDHLCRFALDGVAERRASGHLQFHDLLVLCRDLLASSPAVRRRLHERYRHVLVDEFQDTDPIQIEITRLIATSITDVAGVPWRDLTAEPGRLFFVGDAKQSIYRFRRADIGQFLSVRDAADTDLRSLSTNFRTVPGIVEWVNHAFDRIMGEGVDGAQPRYEPLTAARAAPAASPALPVVVVGGPLDVRRAPERRQAMSDDLAAAVRRVVDQGWQVQDRRGGQWRPARWDDVAVLVPARTGLPELRAAFDRLDVPYRIEASSLVWLTQEVADLLAVLRAVDDPADERALLATLRSPGFACGDDDLARWVAAGGRIDLDAAIPESVGPDDPVRRGVEALRNLRDAAVWDEPSALVERVIRERHLMEMATASHRPRDTWRRLRFVADQARAYVDAEGGTLRDFLQWTDLQADETARVSESILPETDDDAVRVMTIHASKGLEFPVVALAGLDRKPHEKRYVPRLLWSEDGRVEAHLRNDLRMLGFAALEEVDDAHEVHEAWRLMYVAATRARDHLLVCLHHQDGTSAERNVAARLHELVQERPDLWRAMEDLPADAPAGAGLEGESPTDAEATDAPAGAGMVGAGPTDAEAAGAPAGASGHGLDHESERRAREAFIAHRAEQQADAARPGVLAATAIAAAAATPPGAPAGAFDGTPDLGGPAGAVVTAEPGAPAGAGEAALVPDDAADDASSEDGAEPWRRGRAGTSIGRAVHATLQTVDLATGADLAAIAAAQASAEGIPSRAREIEAAARAALASPIVAAAAQLPHWRELYVGAAINGVLCEGYLDLLVDGREGLVVVDYKTDRAPDPAALIPRYRLQAATYALLVEATLDRDVERCVLVVLGPGGAAEVDIDDLDAARDEVRRVVAAHGRPIRV